MGGQLFANSNDRDIRWKSCLQIGDDKIVDGFRSYGFIGCVNRHLRGRFFVCSRFQLEILDGSFV